MMFLPSHLRFLPIESQGAIGKSICTAMAAIAAMFSMNAEILPHSHPHSALGFFQAQTQSQQARCLVQEIIPIKLKFALTSCPSVIECKASMTLQTFNDTWQRSDQVYFSQPCIIKATFIVGQELKADSSQPSRPATHFQRGRTKRRHLKHFKIWCDFLFLVQVSSMPPPKPRNS